MVSLTRAIARDRECARIGVDWRLDMPEKAEMSEADGHAYRRIEPTLSEAKKEISAAEQVLATADEAANKHYRVAAERIAEAQTQKVSQRQIASSVGKSGAWVNRLLMWRKGGYQGSPFGPQSKAKRARQNERSGAPEHDKSRTVKSQKQDDAEEKKPKKANKHITPLTANIPYSVGRSADEIKDVARWEDDPDSYGDLLQAWEISHDLHEAWEDATPEDRRRFVREVLFDGMEEDLSSAA
jgi:hypothetical protein